MKTVARFVVVLGLILVLLWVPPAAVSAEDTVFVRKHVSLLYDNSGSMTRGLRWAYASYAAQAFTGLLNETDTFQITFMNDNGVSQLRSDMKGDRQSAVDEVRENTTVADGLTPLLRVFDALDALLEQGLQRDSERRGAVDGGEQYWLVLTTDGVFEEAAPIDEAEVVETFRSILEEYSQLHMVYFGIGGGQNDSGAVDLSKNTELTAYPNFSAYYAERQEEIVSTMQTLSNQISGRYAVNEKTTVEGDTVTIHIGGESSPIRNIAILAQDTNARLLEAVASDGTRLSIDRSAALSYPYNAYYTNMPEGTLGGYTALISSGSDRKIPAGTVTLRFSEEVKESGLSLMYEPAIYIRLLVERKTAGGDWEKVLSPKRLDAGSTIRVGYALCEDSTDESLDTERLFGSIVEHMSLNGESVVSGQELTLSEGTALISVDLSMMDGTYNISTSRSYEVRFPTVGDYSVATSGPIRMTRSEAGTNTDRYIDFSITRDGSAVDADALGAFTLRAENAGGGALEGEISLPGDGTIRFVPRDGSCASGEYTVSLYYGKDKAADELVTITPEEYYSASVSADVSLLDNAEPEEDCALRFTVIRHLDEQEIPLDAGDAPLFEIAAQDQEGNVLPGEVRYEDGGILAFIPGGARMAAGSYEVSLRRRSTGEKLAAGQVSVIKHDAVYQVAAVTPPDQEVDRFRLRNNTTAAHFQVYADGELCDEAALRSFRENGQLLTELTPDSGLLALETAVRGDTVYCRPVSSAESVLKDVVYRVVIAYGWSGRDELTVRLEVDQVHGDSAESSLRLAGSPRDRLFYLALPWLILLLLIYLVLVIRSNLRMQRLPQGWLKYARLTKDENEDGFHAYPCVTEKLTPQLLTLRPWPKAQEISFHGLRFMAGGRRGSKRLTMVLYDTVDVLDRYSSNSSNSGFLDEMLVSDDLIPSAYVQISDVKPTDSMVTANKNSDKKMTWTPSLSDGCYIAKKEYDIVDNEKKLSSVEIWGFLERNENGGAEGRGGRGTRRRRR